MIPLVSTRKVVPRTTDAVLFCAAENKPTRHTFSRTVEIKDEETGHRRQTKFMFACTCCQAERVWGSED